VLSRREFLFDLCPASLLALSTVLQNKGRRQKTLERRRKLNKSRINQSLSWWCYAREGLAPEKLIKEAARIGYASIEMLPQEHWDLVREQGMKIAITIGHGTLTDGLNRR